MQKRSGFTLVELSIVLVILGLLVGGVLAGQSLIRAAELRSITTEKNNYVVAINAFKEKYMSLPGDMPNAFAFWGTACGLDNTNLDTGCNGNGNGLIRLNSWEHVKAWEHLSYAGLIEGSFDGLAIDDGGGWPFILPTNSPRSKFPAGVWKIDNRADEVPGTAATHFLHFGGVNSNSRFAANSSLTLGEAWIIDTKVDDGRGDTGMLRGDNTGVCFDNGTTDYYSISASGADFAGECVLHFILER